MSLIDLLRMSSGNLKRRKLRTFLTVLGVVIGTASIVVMISLGLGMQESMYKEVEQSGGLTSIQVTGKVSEGGSSMVVMSGGGSDSEKSTKYITDDVIKQLKTVGHVTSVSPVLSLQTVMLKGNYIGYVELTGMTQEALINQKIPLVAGGRLPEEGSSNLELVFGNGIITWFNDKTSGKGYYDTGKLPDIDFATDQLFVILDQDAYFQTQSGGGSLGNAIGQNGGEKKTPVKAPKKHVVRASGIVEGDMETYTANYYSVFCDLETLTNLLKKEFSGRVIPGQPSTKSGKPFKYLTYSSAKVQVDELDHVEEASKAIRDMGFNVNSNVEFMNAMKSQFAIIQAVLGGIGAVSLLVAAIGIANTMMMSIYERTKEIGVIKVLGCGLKNIKQMFLLEAAFIGLFGGIIGNLLSFLMSFVINTLVGSSGAMGFSGNISYIPLWLVLVSMVFAVFVGMVAGYFPALRAMRLSPLAAIRTE